MASRTVELGPFQEPELKNLAVRLADLVTPGDVVLLDGPVGAGKTTFARALIQHILIEPEDIPSPTFTLVQTYETRRGPLWHTDLYRIASVFEIEELGLTEAFETAICCVEWPDILGDLAPRDALKLTFSGAGDTRSIKVAFSATRWDHVGWEHALV